MTDMRQMTAQGRAIEAGSFAVIDEEVGDHQFTDEQWQVVRRVIHSTADFEHKDLVSFHCDPIDHGIKALESSCPIITDVRMIEVGLNKQRLDAFGCQTHCFISDEDVISEAKLRNSTRARVAMEKAYHQGLLEGAIVAVGNAPTSLLELERLYREFNVKPALVVGVPVGFVSAAESKELIQTVDIPSIVTKGRKGGSPIAVSIIHALFYILADRRKR